jgi:hypothetical protein
VSEPAKVAEAEEEDLPAFARSFPKDPRLALLVVAFREGDYARVRREAPALSSGAESEEVRRAARELLSRTGADPLMIGMLVGTGLLLALLTAYWELRR